MFACDRAVRLNQFSQRFNKFLLVARVAVEIRNQPMQRCDIFSGLDAFEKRRGVVDCFVHGRLRCGLAGVSSRRSRATRRPTGAGRLGHEIIKFF